MNQDHASTWGWMLYTDFFLGALGGGILILGSVTTLLYGPETINAAPFLAAVVSMGMGSSLLVIELGNPFRAWRVFTNPGSYLTIGASLMTISTGLSLLLASFYLPSLPWSHSTGLRNTLALLAVLSGFGVSFYPGLLLGEMTSRPFWRGPLLAPLFLLSALSTGIALFGLIDKIWPNGREEILHRLDHLNALFLAAQVIGWSTYVTIKRSLAAPRDRDALIDAFSGSRRIVFWVGFIALGLIIPALIYMSAGSPWTHVAHGLILIGAFIMRGFVVTADQGVPLAFST